MDDRSITIPKATWMRVLSLFNRAVSVCRAAREFQNDCLIDLEVLEIDPLWNKLILLVEHYEIMRKMNVFAEAGAMNGSSTVDGMLGKIAGCSMVELVEQLRVAEEAQEALRNVRDDDSGTTGWQDVRGNAEGVGGDSEEGQIPFSFG